MSAALLATLAWRFIPLAFLMIGGANAIVPEIYRQVVTVERWMSAGEFAALFAIANAAPGPNVLIVTLVGWHVAGVAGALVTTLATIGPTSLLAYAVFRSWDRVAGAPWRRPVQNGLSAVTVGLVAATGLLLARATDESWAAVAVTTVTATVCYATKLNPLWLFAGAGALGAAGFV